MSYYHKTDCSSLLKASARQNKWTRNTDNIQNGINKKRKYVKGDGIATWQRENYFQEYTKTELWMNECNYIMIWLFKMVLG